jgi:hypothetical protein
MWHAILYRSYPTNKSRETFADLPLTPGGKRLSVFFKPIRNTIDLAILDRICSMDRGKERKKKGAREANRLIVSEVRLRDRVTSGRICPA